MKKINYNYIINPLTNRKVSIYSKKARRILNNYINLIGGATGKENLEKTIPIYKLPSIYKRTNLIDNLKMTTIINDSLNILFPDSNIFDSPIDTFYISEKINYIIEEGLKMIKTEPKIELNCNTLCMSIAIINYEIHNKEYIELSDEEKIYIYLVYFLIKTRNKIQIDKDIYVRQKIIILNELKIRRNLELTKYKQKVSALQQEKKTAGELRLSEINKEEKKLNRKIKSKLRQLNNTDKKIEKYKDGTMEIDSKFQKYNMCRNLHCYDFLLKTFDIDTSESNSVNAVKYINKFCKYISKILKTIVLTIHNQYNMIRIKSGFINNYSHLENKNLLMDQKDFHGVKINLEHNSILDPKFNYINLNILQIINPKDIIFTFETDNPDEPNKIFQLIYENHNYKFLEKNKKDLEQSKMYVISQLYDIRFEKILDTPDQIIQELLKSCILYGFYMDNNYIEECLYTNRITIHWYIGKIPF